MSGTKSSPEPVRKTKKKTSARATSTKVSGSAKTVRLRALRECDRIWARAVDRYAHNKLAQAEWLLTEPGLSNFRSFCELWTSRYELAAGVALRQYWTLTHDQRRERYLRFVQQCRSWEATLRLTGRVGMPATIRSQDSSSIRSRVQRLAEEHERISGMYERLAEDSQTLARVRLLPWRVVEAYRILELDPGTDLNEVRSSYRRLANEHHPDRKGDADIMVELSQAYQRIVDYHRPAGVTPHGT